MLGWRWAVRWKISHDAQEVSAGFLHSRACSGEVGRDRKVSLLRAYLLPSPVAKSDPPVQQEGKKKRPFMVRCSLLPILCFSRCNEPLHTCNGQHEPLEKPGKENSQPLPVSLPQYSVLSSSCCVFWQAAVSVTFANCLALGFAWCLGAL